MSENQVEVMRATGRSTRQINDYVQELFKTGACTIIDHWVIENNLTGPEAQRINRHLAKRFEARMELEHKNVINHSDRIYMSNENAFRYMINSYKR